MASYFPRIGIVGSGAVGTYYGARMALAGADVRFLMRGDLAAVRARGSIVIREQAGTTELKAVKAFGSAAEIGPVDLAVIGLKTTSSSALKGLVHPPERARGRRIPGGAFRRGAHHGGPRLHGHHPHRPG